MSVYTDRVKKFNVVKQKEVFYNKIAIKEQLSLTDADQALRLISQGGHISETCPDNLDQVSDNCKLIILGAAIVFHKQEIFDKVKVVLEQNSRSIDFEFENVETAKKTAKNTS